MKVFHLSHIDLDGYGAQYIAKHFFDDIIFFNANYGKEILIRLQEIFTLLKAQNKQNKFLLLITDLNLTLEECKFLQETINELKIQGFDLTLTLLDHHISGEESAKNFHWYHLDNTRSACKITFDTLLSSYSLLDPPKLQWLQDFSAMVNAVDLWKQEEEFFALGKVAMSLIMQLKDPNRLMFESHNQNIKFFFLEKIKDFFYLPLAHIQLDNAFLLLKKQAFNGDPNTQTMDEIVANYLVNLLEKNKDKYTLHFQEHKGVLTYTLGSTSIIGNLFLSQNPDYAFFIDVNARGNVSLRADNACDVSAIASTYFNGGGHKNASGGRIEGFKESFFYPTIKDQVQQILEEKL